MESIESLVKRLQTANWEYHNGGENIMTDDEYDRCLEQLKQRCPTHPFLRTVGAPVKKNSKILPVIMGSLDKLRYGEGTLIKWITKRSNKDFIISEKLDGLSSLYVCDGRGKQMMYLRGDGVRGVDVSRVCSYMNLPIHKCMLRGELVLAHSLTPKGSIGRSLVNGWMHRVLDASSSIPEEVKNIHFVAYQVFEPEGLTREQQITWLKTRGFRTPWIIKKGVKGDELLEESMKELLISRKKESDYPLDGLVIGVEQVPIKVEGGEAKNPEDSVAFKAALDDQKEETRVIQIEWNLSRQGLWIPRIQIEPVEIGGATIQWVSGHNAAAIVEGCLGPGARVVIRRSGDVIPMVEKVLEGATSGVPQMPDSKWEWDEGKVHITGKDGENAEVICKHAIQTLEIDGIGPGLVKKLVEGGYRDLGEIWRASENELANILGKGRGPEFKRKMKEAYEKATQGMLLIASNELPRGIGEKKLRLLYEIEGDAMNWKDKINILPAGWSKETFNTLIESLPRAFSWIQKTFGNIEKKEVKEVVKELVQPNGKVIVFTGVRDKELEEEYRKRGWVIGDTVNKKTTVLVSAKDESVKTKKAREMGIKILTYNESKDFLKGS